MLPLRPKIPGGGLISPLLLIRIRLSHRSLLFLFLLLLLNAILLTFLHSIEVDGGWGNEYTDRWTI